jgi:hypothetical protein
MKKEKWRSARQRSFDEIEGLVKDQPTGNFCKQFSEPPKDGTLVLEIADNGCGISPENQAKLFQPFSQAHKAIYQEYGGTGLGLWLSKTLIQAMKGSIQCKSALGEGTTFTITLPGQCVFHSKKVFNFNLNPNANCRVGCEPDLWVVSGVLAQGSKDQPTQVSQRARLQSDSVPAAQAASPSP